MKDLFLLSEEIYLISGTPFLFINELKNKRKYLILGDIHFGQEDRISNGYSSIISNSTAQLVTLLVSRVKQLGITDIIFNGDIKHNTRSISQQEHQEFKYLFNNESLMGVRKHLIKGNHDEFTDIFLKNNGFEMLPLSDKLEIKRLNYNIVIFHGHEEHSFDQSDILIVSHEHPAYILRGNNGEKLKRPAFVKLRPQECAFIVIVPAANNISTGVSYPIPIEKFLSPTLRKLNYKTMQIYPFDENLGVLPLPEIKY